MSPVRQIETLLRDTMGLDAGTLGTNAVERAVRARLATLAHGAQAPADLHTYWQLLQQSPQELQALIESVVVPETWFFRHREAFVALVGMVRDELQARRGTLRAAQPLRLLSLPCATGEEPYSIAMALLDAGVEPSQFTVDGIDISERALELARAATYGRNSFRGPDQQFDFRDRHFEAQGDNWYVGDGVRAQVRLHAGNLFDPTLADRVGTFDFIFFRNVLIYFDREGQRRAIAALSNLMRMGATLFAGPAEGGAVTSAGLVSTGHSQAFSFRLTGPVRDLEVPSANVPSLSAMAAAPAVPGTLKRFGAHSADDLAPMTAAGAMHRRVASPHVASDPLSLTLPASARMSVAAGPSPAARRETANRRQPERAAPEESSTRLAQAAALADAGEFDRAGAICRDVLNGDRGNAQAEYLLGLVSDARGENDAALEHYRRTLYLSPNHYEALVHCAALLEARGDGPGAQRLRARAERAAPSAERRHEGDR